MVDREEIAGQSTTNNEIDHLCQLIDQNQFGICSRSTLKCRSVCSSEVKAFRLSRLKRLNCCSSSKNDHQIERDEKSSRSLVPCTRRTFSMRFSLSPSSLIHRFRSLSTLNLPSTRQNLHFSSHHRRNSFPYSSSSITLLRTKSILPSIVEEETIHDPSSTNTQTQLSCTIVDTRRSTTNPCNVEELAAYLDHFLYLPKSLSGAAELMYT